MALQLSQLMEATHQNRERDQREQDAAITVQVAVKEPDVDLCGEEPKRHNPNRVCEHRNRNGQQCETDLRSQGLQEQVSDQKTGDEQSTSGMNGSGGRDRSATVCRSLISKNYSNTLLGRNRAKASGVRRAPAVRRNRGS